MQSQTRKLAEKSARTYLEMRSFKVLELNWSLSKTKIDLIAEKNGTIYFIEIKYYLKPDQPSRIDPMTQTKLDQYSSAAEAWTTESKYGGKYMFASIELAGPNYSVLSFNEDLI